MLAKCLLFSLIVTSISLAAPGIHAQGKQAAANTKQAFSIIYSKGDDAATLTGAVNLASHKSKTSSLKFVNLSSASELQCCVTSVSAKTKKSSASATRTGTKVAIRERSARSSYKTDGPYYGLVVPQSVTSVVPVDANTFNLLDAKSATQYVVRQCVSTETLHVRIRLANTSKDYMRYAIPLGYDVEDTCGDSLSL